MDCSKPDEAEAGEDVGLPDAVVADPDGTDARGTLLPLGTFANVVGEIEGLVNEGLLDGSFRTPTTENGLEEPEALERLTGLAGADEPDGKDVDPETGEGEGEELDGDAGGELADRDPEGRDDVDPDGVMTTRTRGELDEVDDPKVGVEIGLVGIEELDIVEVDEEDELLVVTLEGAVVELELEEVVDVVPQPDIVEYDVTHSISYHVVSASES